MIFTILFSIALAYGNCEVEGYDTGNSFHTVAVYEDDANRSKTSHISGFQFIDDYAFLANYTLEISSERGLGCENFSVKKIIGENDGKGDGLRISGCKRSAFEGELFLSEGTLMKKIKRDRSKLVLNEKEIFLVKEKIRQSGLLADIKIAETRGMQFANKTEEETLKKNMDRYKLTWATSFSVLGKKMNWYLFTAQAKFKLMVQKPISEGGGFDRPRDLEKFYEEPLPLVVYEYDNTMHYFGNGLHGECELNYRIQSMTTEVNSEMPYTMPSSVYELPGVVDKLIIHLGAGAVYLWNVNTKVFKVISGG